MLGAEAPPIDPRHTWNSQVPVQNPDEVLSALRRAKLLVNVENGECADEDEEGDTSANERLVCVLEITTERIKALVATPSGRTYRFEPIFFCRDFWGFAASHYYIITGNLADRALLAELAGVDPKRTHGRALIRKKSKTSSGLELDDILGRLGVPRATQPPRQASLF